MFAVNNAGGEDQQDKEDYKDECTIFLLFLKKQCSDIITLGNESSHDAQSLKRKGRSLNENEKVDLKNLTKND